MNRRDLESLHPLLRDVDLDLIERAPKSLRRRMAVHLEKIRAESRYWEQSAIELALGHVNNAHLIPARATSFQDAQRLWMHLRRAYSYLTFTGMPPFAHTDPSQRRRTVCRQIQRIFTSAEIGDIEAILKRPLTKKPKTLNTDQGDSDDPVDH
jgi:hypothetical protein